MFNIKYIYSIIFISLSGWAIYAYLTTTEIIQSQKVYAHIINISGKQRMLSQKTALIAKRFNETKDQLLKTHLIELYIIMEKDHHEIISTHITSNEIKAIYYQAPEKLNKNTEHYLSLLSYYIKTQDTTILKELEIASFKLLPKINNAVSAFEAESNKKTGTLLERKYFILMGTLLTLIIEAIVIVIPSIRISTRNEEKLQQLVKDRTHELEKLSVTDQLTGLYNRRKIDTILMQEVEQAQRYYHSFSLILIDIDYFKKVNDTYGHQVGDDVLQTIANLFSTHVRKSDFVGRWGGEEFLIISLEKDLEKTLIFAEKLRALIQSRKIANVGSMTCSFGISHFIKDDTVSSLLTRTDIALYEAKAAGRNCVKVKNT